MREILFRGKRLDNGEWVKGFITAACDCAGRLYFIEQPAQDLDDCNHSWEVDFTTIGQYTGLNDKDGTKIFEGDIVEFTDFNGDTTPYEVFYDGNNGKFAVAENGNRNFVDDFELFERNEYFKWFTVIGNVYDNPELLKGGGIKMTHQNNQKCLEILKHYGVSPQLRKLAEECGEAVQAALKYDYRANEITKQALITEIADLEITVQQIKFVVGYEKVDKEIDFKLNRQLERIKNARKIEEE